MVTTGVLLLWAVVQTVAVYRGAAVRGEVGWDANVYASIGTHFLETARAYFPVQSAPYDAEGIVNIYPPTALYLFVPASLLPRLLWWVVPLFIIGWSLYRIRPAWWAWPLMAIACVLPVSAPAVPVALVYGNSLLWTMAALFAAAAFRPGIAWAALFKPTDVLVGLPLALRSWRGLALAIGMSVILLPLWFDWLDAMRNLEGSSPLRGLSGWPALAIPLVARASRSPRWPSFRWRARAQTAAATSNGRTVRAPSS
jgi:hypothetical protein